MSEGALLADYNGVQNTSIQKNIQTKKKGREENEKKDD